MKSILLAAPMALALSACGGTPAEEAQDVQDEAVEAKGDVMDEQSEALEAQADALDDAGMESQADVVDSKADAMEDAADKM